MGKKDPRVDAYIAKSAEFARPILAHLRKLVHAACPDVEETIKWRTPHFDYRGSLAGMAAFKQHCAFGFWKGKLLFGGDAAMARKSAAAAGQFGRITCVRDLPKDAVIKRWIRQAAKLNEDGVAVPRLRPARARALVVPDDFMKVLRRNKAALAAFEAFPPSHKREYVEWITEAKTDATRERRMATAVEWLTAGKSRNWKYQKK